MILQKSDWQHLIPHRDAMSVLDDVVSFDDTSIHMTALSHVDRGNPLRSDDQLRAVHLCEYGAQAMAVHGGLLAQRDGAIAAPGFLVSLRGVSLQVDRVDLLDGPLDIFAEKLLDSATSWQYAFRVEHRGSLLAEGRAAVVAQTTPNPDASLSPIR